MREDLLDYIGQTGDRFCIFRLSRHHFILDSQRIPKEVAADEVKCLRELCQQWDGKGEDCGLKNESDD